MENPYKTLGVPSDASQEAIHGAFRTLAKQCHPDTHPNSATAEGEFKAISNADDMLSDPNRRDRYDCGGAAEPAAESASAKAAGLARMRRKKVLDTTMFALSAAVGAIGILRCVY